MIAEVIRDILNRVETLKVAQLFLLRSLSLLLDEPLCILNAKDMSQFLDPFEEPQGFVNHGSAVLGRVVSQKIFLLGKEPSFFIVKEGLVVLRALGGAPLQESQLLLKTNLNVELRHQV